MLAACAQPQVPLFTDLGTFARPGAAPSRQSQAYFDQGLRLYYGFNQAEAARAFAEGARLDGQCAMCWWGVAMANAPNINIPMDSASEAAARDAAQRAVALKDGAREADRGLIEALAVRFGPVATGRPGLDSAYASAMRDLAARYPDDNDIVTLSAESAMLLRPWNYWQPDGSPYPGTAELVAALGGVVARDSMHPGACHYFIHAVEKVQPQLAVPCAERLPSLVPGAGHLVHMPAHIYFRVGRYADAVSTNEHASHADAAYIEGVRPGGVYPMFYTPHNHHFRAAAEMMQGRYAQALEAARTTSSLAPLENVRAVPPTELYVPVPLYIMARFEKWDDILREPKPEAPELGFTRALWHYARGLAFAATGRPDSARRAADSVTAIAAAYPPEPTVGFNSAKTLLQIADHALRGEMAARAGYPGDAVRHFNAAIAIEDGLTYDEPPDWYYPVRQSLGATQLAAGQARQAEATFREDLRRYPENGWSLRGLRDALRAQGRTAAADSVDARFRAAWKGE